MTMSREKQDSLLGVFNDIRKDESFGSLAKRSRFVPGTGSHFPIIVIVGEAPGVTENETGKPFTGKSGQVLEGLLHSTLYPPAGNSPRDMVYMTNIIKYQPQGRKPTLEEIDAARPYLNRELALVCKRTPPHNERPIVCLMGKTAGMLLGKHGIERGGIVSRKGWRFAYLYDPSVALHDPNMLEQMKAQFRAVVKNL